jgi:ribosomal protein S18 acetylase RimI-like enzyme
VIVKTSEPEANRTEMPSHPRSGGQAPLRLKTFDWSGFVAQHFDLTFVGGTVATVVGVALINPADWPKGLVFAVPITATSAALALSLFALAFTRVWKTVREEHETSALWEQLVDEVSPRGTAMENVKDVVFEVPYLFSILVLPFSLVTFQSFALCLVLFYACDNYYNLALVRKIGTDHCARLPGFLASFVALGHRVRGAFGGRITGLTEPVLALLGAATATACSVVDPAPNSIDRVVLMRYFGRRARLDTIAIWLLLGALVAVTMLASLDRRDLALMVGLVVAVALLVTELVVEPFRALGVQYQPTSAEGAGTSREVLLWSVPSGAALDSRLALETMHEDAFRTRERHYSVDDMLTKTGRRGFLLLLLTEREEPTEAHALAGYVFLQACPERGVAFFWYLAVAAQRRRQGLGTTMMRLALEVVRDRWPSVVGVFLETDHPASGEAKDSRSVKMRRVRFYQGLGFTWVRGIEYQIPAHDEPDSSLRYDPMFVATRGLPEDIDDRFAKAAVLEMARDSFDAKRSWPFARREPDDPRWATLLASMDGMYRVVPTLDARDQSPTSS